jgi:hypothetical protein
LLGLLWLTRSILPQAVICADGLYSPERVNADIKFKVSRTEAFASAKFLLPWLDGAIFYIQVKYRGVSSPTVAPKILDTVNALAGCTVELEFDIL